jgi:hypothetical protein
MLEVVPPQPPASGRRSVPASWQPPLTPEAISGRRPPYPVRLRLPTANHGAQRRRWRGGVHGGGGGPARGDLLERLPHRPGPSPSSPVLSWFIDIPPALPNLCSPSPTSKHDRLQAIVHPCGSNCMFFMSIRHLSWFMSCCHICTWRMPPSSWTLVGWIFWSRRKVSNLLQ